ncbi:MAG TPA: glycoside hydrolase family 15 protein [Micromonosporaceae bacterium]
MPLPLEDYAFIGDLHTGALVGRDGSIDWLCLPRFDSGACFAALLGEPENGRWLLAPAGDGYRATRRYRGDTLVLETEFQGPDGVVRVVDCMPVRQRHPDVVRRVEGVSGRVRMRCELRPRFDYGHVVPWIRRDGDRLYAVAGPDTLAVDADVPLDVHDETVVAEFEVNAGDRVGLRMAWTGPRQDRVAGPDRTALDSTEQWWRDWSADCSYQGPYRDQVVRSLITLKALTYAPSGGIVAALTTSLPEKLGGVRNWDYRYCWIRDATYTLLVLMEAGYTQAAKAWREWLLRALAGRPEQMQIMYGIDGERRLTELQVDWLSGYQGASPVRIGNAASGQFQLDVYGELMDALHQARCSGLQPSDDAWQVQRVLLDFLESHWQDPDDGIWEVRGDRRDFTHSKVMAWVAVDRAIKATEHFGLDGPADRWRALRQEIFDEVCEKGYDRERQTFTRYYGSKSLDAATLLIAPVGFLPAHDERVKGTVAAIERELLRDGFVQRYSQDDTRQVDGLPPGEGAFLACTYWLADNYLLLGRVDDAKGTFERLLGLANDVGLLSEEYDVHARRQVGNFPQALSHLQLVSTAFGLRSGTGPTGRRAQTGRSDDSG